MYFAWADQSENDTGQYQLHETANGLFFTSAGQALDFRSTPPAFRNIKLKKVGSGPSPFAWGLLAVCGLVMLSILLFLPLRSIWRRGSESRSGSPGIAAATASNVLTIVTSVCGLVCISTLAIIPRLIYSGYLGRFPLSTGFWLLFHAPFGLAAGTVGLVALVMLAWKKNWWTRGKRWHYTALVVATLAETALLAGWRLIGFE